jgi:hypothetical protein
VVQGVDAEFKSYKKKKRICSPVIPAPWEVEVEGSYSKTGFTQKLKTLPEK